ncbi:hypothetical protein [Hymenobacter koreensis]|uniref:Uncharacterized protein n=1 Tax=Hymenobacter koreensis TaxID=1084523 RepID=A0ABP8JNN1_9BACT
MERHAYDSEFFYDATRPTLPPAVDNRYLSRPKRSKKAKHRRGVQASLLALGIAALLYLLGYVVPEGNPHSLSLSQVEAPHPR